MPEQAKPPEPEVLTCMSRIQIRGGQIRRLEHRCGARIGYVTEAYIPTGRVLKNPAEMGSHCVAPWCHSCKRATEYRRLTVLECA